jgi:hypothetical protein
LPLQATGKPLVTGAEYTKESLREIIFLNEDPQAYPWILSFKRFICGEHLRQFCDDGSKDCFQKYHIRPVAWLF